METTELESRKKELRENCQGLAGICTDAVQWVTRNGALVGNEQNSLLKDLRRSFRIFRRCEQAVDRKMCVGVFGPSQSGKSYLISSLARGMGRKSLICDFDGEKCDFLEEINPWSGGSMESTGLVTRFTMEQPSRPPKGYPVRLRLLKETDLVKIIANTYFADCKHTEKARKGPEDISNTLTKLEMQKTGMPSECIDQDALEDIKEYLTKRFGDNSRVRDLETVYWERALRIGPELVLQDRVQLYALIWDEIPQLTDLLFSLLGFLEKLGNTKEVYCQLKEALFPHEGETESRDDKRKDSIIVVETLHGLNRLPDPGKDLHVSTGTKIIQLPRAVVTALTAELIIVMDELPAEYFRYVDLLDFPGYRSRLANEHVREKLAEAPKEDGTSTLTDMFLRGKVAYLFQRYNEERELSAMVLCIGDGLQEVADLPGVIDDWVGQTHGFQPADRAGKDVSLLVVLTMIDRNFEETMGAPSNPNRWNDRLKASLLNYLGRKDWPWHWDSEEDGHRFTNLFLLRNPGVKWHSIMDYDDEGQETGIRRERAAYVNDLKKLFLESSEVKAHFCNPDEAWDAVMELNDGGITRISKNLAPLCDPAVKQKQLEQNAADTRDRIILRLAAFYRENDARDKDIRKRKLIKTLQTQLEKLMQEGRFGLLLQRFTINDADIELGMDDRFKSMPGESGKEERAQKPAQDPVPDTRDDQKQDDGGWIGGNIWKKYKANAAKTETSSAHEIERFADRIVGTWVENLRTLADSPDQQRYFMLPGQVFSELVDELAKGLTRFGLRKKMIEEFHKAANYSNRKRDEVKRLQACLAAYAINRYMDWLGLDPSSTSPEQRTVEPEPGETVELFEPLPEVQGFPTPKEMYNDVSYNWIRFADWLGALQKLIWDNASYDGEAVNIQENQKLGALLDQLKAKKEPAP